MSALDRNTATEAVTVGNSHSLTIDGSLRFRESVVSTLQVIQDKLSNSDWLFQSIGKIVSSSRLFSCRRHGWVTQKRLQECRLHLRSTDVSSVSLAGFLVNDVSYRDNVRKARSNSLPLLYVRYNRELQAEALMAQYRALVEMGADEQLCVSIYTQWAMISDGNIPKGLKSWLLDAM